MENTKQTEFSKFVKKRATMLGRSEASVRSKLYHMGITAADNPQKRDIKVLDFIYKKKFNIKE